MTNSALYNGQNLDFTGNNNPYGLIQKAGKRTRNKNRGTRNKKRGTRYKKRVTRK